VRLESNLKQYSILNLDESLQTSEYKLLALNSGVVVDQNARFFGNRNIIKNFVRKKKIK
jgi:hypothetical protein